jgi:hypothetical protein
MEQNPVAVDILMAQTWEMPHGIGDTTSWLRGYVQARYPYPVPETAHRAWGFLLKGQYQCGCVDAPCTVAVQEPGEHFLGLSTCNKNNPPWVCTGNPDDTTVGDAWASFLAAAESGGEAYMNSDTFGYDLVGTTAQALNMVMFDCQNATAAAVMARDLSTVRTQRRIMLDIIAGLDALMGTRSLFLLGNWLQGAREWANSSAPYTATCEVDPTVPRVPCSTGKFVRGGRVCDGAPGSKTTVTTNCTASAHCATCITGSFGTANISPCLTCQKGYEFFDFGGIGCAGSCNSANTTSIPIDLCEFRNCCYNDTVPGAACFERPRSVEAQYVIDAKTVITLLSAPSRGG